jgi:hypothetical protein
MMSKPLTRRAKAILAAVGVSVFVLAAYRNSAGDGPSREAARPAEEMTACPGCRGTGDQFHCLRYPSLPHGVCSLCGGTGRATWTVYWDYYYPNRQGTEPLSPDLPAAAVAAYRRPAAAAHGPRRAPAAEPYTGLSDAERAAIWRQNTPVSQSSVEARWRSEHPGINKITSNPGYR